MIAIHINPKLHTTRYGHPNYEERWVKYCQDNCIEYKLVSAYDSDILAQLKGCKAFMWNFTQNKFADSLFAKQLILSVNMMGVRTFPTVEDMWHFDDKVGQKYLLEAIRVPHINTFVSYSKHEALLWASGTSFPKVFKLRGGAGSAQVFLINNRYKAIQIINKAFGRGISLHNRTSIFKEKVYKFLSGQDKLGIIKAFYFLLFSTPLSKSHGREKGYVYFQDYIPNNDHDIRVVVVDNKAYAIKRLVRKGDFRASGSGNIIYNHIEIDLRCVKLAFDVSRELNSSSLNYDFIFDENNNPLIVEISYTNKASGYDACDGYWDKELNWHQGKFNPYGWMVEMMK